jgi:hypothetical protein
VSPGKTDWVGISGDLIPIAKTGHSIRSNMPLIADVKYKPNVSVRDRYQVISHTVSLGSPRAVIVLPAFAEGPESLARKGQVHDTAGIELYEYHLRIDSDLGRRREELMVRKLCNLPTLVDIMLEVMGDNYIKALAVPLVIT